MPRRLCRYWERRCAGRLGKVAFQLGQSLFIDEIGTAQSDDFRFARQARIIGFEFTADDAPRFDGVIACGVDEMQEQFGAFDVTEEAVADPGAFGCAFDQSRNIGEHELAASVATTPSCGRSVVNG